MYYVMQTSCINKKTKIHDIMDHISSKYLLTVLHFQTSVSVHYLLLHPLRQHWLWTMCVQLRALGPPGPALPARSCFFVRYVYARNHWLCLLWRANLPSAVSHGAGSLLLSLQLPCSWRNSPLIAGLHVLLSDFTCLGNHHQHYTHFYFSVDLKKLHYSCQSSIIIALGVYGIPAP